MFWTLYTCRLKVSLRSWETTFWTWIFPLMMATLFFFAFARLDSADAFSPVKTAVVTDAAYEKAAAFRRTVDSVSAEGDKRLLDLTAVDAAAEADALLEKGKIDGYLSVDPDGAPRLTVREDGINQTILKSFLDQYRQTASSLTRIAAQDPAALPAAMEQLADPAAYTTAVTLSAAPPSVTVGYYYALLAMVCLYGGFIGLDVVTYLQANLSALGARRGLSPVSKMRMVLADLCGGFTVQIGCVLLVLAYIALILRVPFGGQAGFILLTCVMGSLVGVALGALVTAALRLKVVVKTAILITVSMVFCFLAGLMVGGVNYTVEKAAPLVAWLNPAARIADAFYCLYYYDTYARYFLNIGVLLAMAAVLFGGAVFFLRRQKYESI